MADDVIRDFGKLHGFENLSDSDVQSVKRKISNVYIDRVLDAEIAPTTETPAPETTDGDKPE
jgi:hypothetical protein